ncbi:uncharacterized protein METZ01_LOCUS125833 [marine metagenome]|uniref:4Fe-4S ferredoxin-type domain-containing protein n=1 Tax=marine metagenome TaxID=408172 RepID=A0A381Y7D7_9ZZZZ
MIKRVWIEEGCVTCGNSEQVCPEVFEINIEKETAEIKNVDDLSIFADQIKLAAASCPVSVIKYEEE